MWVLKLSMFDEKGIFSCRNKKFKVKTYAYRTGYYTKSKKANLNAILLIEGNEKNKNNFIKSLKDDKYVKNIEVKGNLINCHIIKPLKISSKRKENIFYSLNLIHIKPVFTNEEATEIWEIGSWNREILQKILKFAKNLYEGKLLYLKKLKLSESDFLFFSLYPKLTQKQKTAFLLALDKGYYEFPRNIELKELAKLMKLSYTSYQFHLRKAERKIMNSVGSKI